MPTPQSLPWIEPLDLASTIDEPYWVLLYSATQTSYSGRYSYLAHGLKQKIEDKDFTALGHVLSHDRPCWDNAWFGYFGYGLKYALEKLPADPPGTVPLPELCMMQFANIIIFDHQEKTLTCHSESPATIPATASRTASPLPPVESITSNMTTEAYLQKVSHVIERIRAGDLYQANLTRKFSIRFTAIPNAFSLFQTLCTTNPAPYSAFLKLGECAVLSSSPEMFLAIDAEGHIKARPIKGTSRRYKDPQADKQSYEALATSNKDRAENLMIVDLMRNDLSKSSQLGSIRVEKLFDITSHTTVHHMSSTIVSQKHSGCSTLEAIQHCFPPGSMTGAPKIKAMTLCSELEPQARGVYSGAIGWLGGDGSAELSVVIRTLIVNGTYVEFQVGGGIVSDSTPLRELDEIIDKSKGIMSALGLTPGHIKSL